MGKESYKDYMRNESIFLTKINQILVDAVIFTVSLFAAFIIRFEGIPNPVNLKQLLIFFPFIVLARIVSFQLFSVYSIAWRYISILDAVSIFKACFPVTTLLFIGRLLLPDRLELFRFPFSSIALEFLLVLLGTLSARMARRLFHEKSERAHFEDKGTYLNKKNVLLIGAGNAGNMVAKELRQRADLGLNIMGFIDDDPGKLYSVIQGVRVLGFSRQIPQIVHDQRIDEAIITIANASSKEIRRIVDVCKGTRIKVKIVPGLFEMLDDNIKITKIREINIDDLLGRSVINLESHLPEIGGFYRNKRILVTGAGGSIGAELCRQLSVFSPKELILLDKDENSIYEIDFELRTKQTLRIRPVVADIRDAARLSALFKKHEPEILFHAAAHKHVPLMESNITEAVLNNVIGTKNVAFLADRFQVKNVIYVSSDKAVNPTNVMGATKKIGEIIIQDVAGRSRTQFVCVRFGNVLGSRGSVVPLFQKQISQGGPITITHPDMARYFMSISEAVQLIIQAGTIGSNGEIYVLDMGEPIKIVDLAKDLIKLSGYSENDFEIQVIGLRPGEKLFEEILIDEEKTKVTKFKKIFIAPPIEANIRDFAGRLSALLQAAKAHDEKRIIEGLKMMNIGYRPDLAEPILPPKFVH